MTMKKHPKNIAFFSEDNKKGANSFRSLCLIISTGSLFLLPLP